MSACILLAGLAGDLLIEARAGGLCAATTRAGVRLARLEEWPEAWFDSPKALQAALQMSRLAEIGRAVEESPGAWRIPYASFPALLAEGFTLPFLWSDWSPLTLAVRTHGTLADDNLRFSARFRLGDMEVETERAGRYVRRAGHSETWLLDDLSFALLERIDSYRGGEARWIDFAFVKAYASELCAETDVYLRDNDVVFPAAVQTAGIGSPFLGEVPGELFRRAFRSVSTVNRRLSILLPNGGWTHLVFDDGQLDLLRAWKASGRVAYRPEYAPDVPVWGGRVGIRQATIGSRPEMVPVRLRSEVSGVDAPPGGRVLYDRDVQNMRRRELEALIACLYAARGFHVLLAAEGCGAGASVVAVRDGAARLVRVETAPAGMDSLEALVRMRAAWRRFYDHPYRMSLIVRNRCGAELALRAGATGVELWDEVRLIDGVESQAITPGDVSAAEHKRCLSTLDLVGRLRRLL
jgi:hypothetical protein